MVWQERGLGIGDARAEWMRLGTRSEEASGRVFVRESAYVELRWR